MTVAVKEPFEFPEEMLDIIRAAQTPEEAARTREQNIRDVFEALDRAVQLEVTVKINHHIP